jgi:hypothetical protein
MRLSWYADTGVAVFSIWQGGTCTGTFRLPVADLPRMVQILQRGPHGDAGQAGQADRTGQHSTAAAPGGRHSGSHARPPSDEPTGIYRPEDDWTPPGYVPGSRAGYDGEPPPGYQPGPPPGYRPQPPPGYFDDPPGFGGTGEVPGYEDPGEFGPGSYDESPVRPYVAHSGELPGEHAGESFPYGPPPAPPRPRHRSRNPGGH